jgi:hypothetical protein
MAYGVFFLACFYCCAGIEPGRTVLINPSDGSPPGGSGDLIPRGTLSTLPNKTVLLMPNAVCQDVWVMANVFDGRQTIRGIEALMPTAPS